MTPFIFLLWLLQTTSANLTTTTLTGNLYIEDIGKVHQYDETWTLVIGVNTTNTGRRLDCLRETLILADEACNGKCNEAREIKLVEARLKRLQAKESILNKLLGRSRRGRRGLINFVGNILKTLFGTLSERDLNQINDQFDKLYLDNRNIAAALRNHTRILKILLDSSSTNYGGLLNEFNKETKVMHRLDNTVNENTKNSFVNAKLVVCTLLIDELNEDMDIAINAINDGKHGVVHPQILTPGLLKETIGEFEKINKQMYHFDNTEDNYQHIIDISTIQVAVVQGLLTYIVKMPILEAEEGTIKHVIPLPERIQETFLALVPDHEYIISYKDSFSPTDTVLLNKCKQLSEYKICERRQPNYRLTDTDSCDSSLLKRNIKTRCNQSPYLLHKDTYIYVHNGYIVIPTEAIEIGVLCLKNLTTIIITKTTLITGENCKIYSRNIELKLPSAGTLHKITTINVSYELNFDKQDLEMLKDRLVQLPQQLDNEELKRARLSLDDTESMLDRIGTHRRIKTWTEKSVEWLQYLGYFAMIVITLYTSYKCGIIDCLKTCMPSRICLFCIKTKVYTNATRQIVTYNRTANEEPLLKGRVVRFSDYK